MKKAYIIPQLQLITVGCETLIAQSFSKNEEGADEDVVLIKEDNSIGSGNSIWDDDWND